ncbi:lysophospholipid acyltransferase family protein [Massilicoli timonensis]|uniref:lysophospholipid acyltransferase family protein n=1 Tax=Massilicoli timonensis TaxID=2015901 RepID=UPI0015E0776C|nr:lysophospholipid acyltransferase family protein [Massilicoli timonensis]
MEPIRYFCERVKKSGDISVKVSGREHIPSDRGFIFYPNHQGLFDAVAVADGTGIMVSPLIKKELMSYPLIKQLFSCVDAMPMDRNDIRQSMCVLQEVQKRVEAGKVCLIFPEGTRSKQGNKMLDFKPGSFKPAVKTRCPIVPIALVDSFKPFDTNTTGHITVHLHILKPLLWEDYQGMTTTEIAQIVKGKIQCEMETILLQNGEPV